MPHFFSIIRSGNYGLSRVGRQLRLIKVLFRIGSNLFQKVRPDYAFLFTLKDEHRTLNGRLCDDHWQLHVCGVRGAIFHAQTAKAASYQEPFCEQKQICADATNSGEYYTGHDEPSALFYSNTPGAGNSYISHLTLPNDPPTLPLQDGTGGTFNFQLHPTFWFGMAMCDTRCDPERG